MCFSSSTVVMSVIATPSHDVIQVALRQLQGLIVSCFDANEIMDSKQSLPSSSETLEPNKRPAYAGQWRTPPLPLFPTNQQQQEIQDPTSEPASTMAAVAPIMASQKLPSSTEDYVKALQEAYLKGAAEAAAMAKCGGQSGAVPQPAPVASDAGMQQQQQHLLPPQHHSAPSFIHNGANMQMGGVPGPYSGGPTADGNNMMNQQQGTIYQQAAGDSATFQGAMSQQQQRQQQHSSQPNTPMVVSQQAPPDSSMMSGIHVGNAGGGQSLQQQPQLNDQHYHHSEASLSHHQQQQQPPVAQLALSPQQQQQQRSISLPDMSAYASQQHEEAKRQKRLARNRASARLRRLRKKNLVDAYETEVGLLERTLAQLRAHTWGAPSQVNAAAMSAAGAAAENRNKKNKSDQHGLPLSANDAAMQLIEALSMDRGQQELSEADRKQAVADILQQQLAYVQQLEELMQEQFALYQLANESKELSPEFQELKHILCLSPEQCQRLREEEAGWSEEWTAIQTVRESLTAMKENEWLWNNNSVGQIAEQFLGILHQNQISKFMLWADANGEAIDELDGVHAPPRSASPAQGPIFQFGVDHAPTSLAMAASGSMGNLHQEPTLEDMQQQEHQRQQQVAIPPVAAMGGLTF